MGLIVKAGVNGHVADGRIRTNQFRDGPRDQGPMAK
jgi:hypothetical protein